jgi:hypothetical protein
MQHGIQKIILLLLASSPWCYGQASAGPSDGTTPVPEKDRRQIVSRLPFYLRKESPHSRRYL